MSEELVDSQTASKTQIQAVFEEVARRSMHDFSFLHPNMPVYVPDLTLSKGQWTGYIITSWMLSALIFPGPDQTWPARKVGEKIGLRPLHDEMTFTVGELEGVSQYLSCSLISPPPHSVLAQEDVRPTDGCARMLLSLSVNDPDAPQLSRRALLLGRRSCENA